MFRVVQISDTHLSPLKPHFAGNWPPLAAWIAAQKPDLVVHSGDVTVDGADIAEDLRHCAGLLQNLGVRFRAVPGNHDVGDAKHRHQPVNRERLARWDAHFGPDRWCEDIEGWRLIGFDAMLIGSDAPEEQGQLAWLEEIMAAAPGRRFAWFLHKPLFLDSPEEGDTGYWSVKPEQRRPLMALGRRFGVGLVASGHLHKAHHFSRDGVEYVWAPSSAFLCGPSTQPAMPGEKRLGAVVYEFVGADVCVTIEDVPGLAVQWIDEMIERVYPLHLDSRPPQ